MKQLGLNNEQATKLLEMCKNLFPIPTFRFIENSIEVGMLELWINDGKPKELSWECIHWFEFTLTHLAKQVAIYYGQLPYSSHSWALHLIKSIMCDTKKHPVDQLYDIWKNPQDYTTDL